MRGAHGFSLIELLIALTIGALLSAGVAAVVPPARAAFEVTPSHIDLQRRGRAAVDILTQSIRAAGGDAEAAEELGPLHQLVPAVIPRDVVDGRFRRLTVIAPRPDGGQGILAAHQAGSYGPLLLAEACPNLAVVCGLARDVTALITDGSGRFDVFTVATADAAARALTAGRALTPPYVAGSIVLDADVSTFQLQDEPDGSQTLVRVTGGGAVQPLVDRVSELSFELYGVDHAGELQILPAASFLDGPWLRGEPGGEYDEGTFEIRAVTVMMTVQPSLPASSSRTFRFTVSLRNAS